MRDKNKVSDSRFGIYCKRGRREARAASERWSDQLAPKRSRVRLRVLEFDRTSSLEDSPAAGNESRENIFGSLEKKHRNTCVSGFTEKRGVSRERRGRARTGSLVYAGGEERGLVGVGAPGHVEQ